MSEALRKEIRLIPGHTPGIYGRACDVLTIKSYGDGDILLEMDDDGTKTIVIDRERALELVSRLQEMAR